MIQLNKQQKNAAEFHTGVASVVAVPGSGKTLTMTHRIGNLVLTHGVPPESILGLTFTRNAAKAMRLKLKPVLEDKTSRVNLSTIHSFCHHLLRDEGQTFEMLHGKAQIRFIRKVMQKLKVKNIPTGIILSEINLAKNNLVTADVFGEIHSGDEYMQKIADIFAAYETEKKRKLLMDFNDLLINAHHLLNTDADVRERYRQTYNHVLVDEYQDTNPAQIAILNLLANAQNGNGSSFWICGDDWQSIYSFAGSSPGNILNFSRIFPDSKRFILETNYRSTPQILKVCQRLIDCNQKKIEKTLKTANGNGPKVFLIEAANEEDEALQIASEIKDMTENGTRDLRQIAVLYRANSQSRAVEEAFTQHQIPYHIENGMTFYQRYEVKVLLDYLRLINDPNSGEGDDALRSVINVPNRYIGRKFIGELDTYADKRDVHLYQGLKTLPVSPPYLRKNVKAFIEILEPLMADAGKLEPSEVIHMLRETLDYDRYIAEDDLPSPDDSKIANINQLQLASNRFTDIRTFINHTETFKEKISNDENGVSLMTIHKSKGLEFPTVFVIGFMDGVLPNKCGDLEEERRIAFVGLSRAMHHLYATYATTYMGRSIKKSQFLDEMMGQK